MVSAIAVLIVFCSLVRMDLRFGGTPPALARTIDGWFRPLNAVSGYGLFAIMTTNRREIVMEGSYDGVEWQEYEFRYKPGDEMRAPPSNIPHQPRLDWQMWFAALDDPKRLSCCGASSDACPRTSRPSRRCLRRTRLPTSRPHMCGRSSTTISLPAAIKPRVNGGTGDC